MFINLFLEENELFSQNFKIVKQKMYLVYLMIFVPVEMQV